MVLFFPQQGYPILYLDFLAEWIFVMCCIYFCCILCVEVTCLGASIAVIRYLRRHRHCFNPQTYRMQLQLIILLIIQVKIEQQNSLIAKMGF
jgi:hypothetical protein